MMIRDCYNLALTFAARAVQEREKEHIARKDEAPSALVEVNTMISKIKLSAHPALWFQPLPDQDGDCFADGLVNGLFSSEKDIGFGVLSKDQAALFLIDLASHFSVILAENGLGKESPRLTHVLHAILDVSDVRAPKGVQAAFWCPDSQRQVITDLVKKQPLVIMLILIYMYGHPIAPAA